MLKANLAKLEEPWNPTDNINVLWKQVKDCKEFAVKGKEPIAESTVVRIIIDNFLIHDAFKHAMDIVANQNGRRTSKLRRHSKRTSHMPTKSTPRNQLPNLQDTPEQPPVTPEPTPTKQKK